MEEYEYDADRTDVAYSKEEYAIEHLVMLSVVGELVEDQLARNIPAYKQTGEHTTQGQHDVGCQLVAEVHERHS